MICMGCGCSYQDCTCHLLPEQDEELVCHFCGAIHHSLEDLGLLMCVSCSVELTAEDTDFCIRCGDELYYHNDYVCGMCELDTI